MSIRDMERLEQYRANEEKNGPYILEYEYNGDNYATCARTRVECITRTDEKCGGKGWILNNFDTQKAWRESVCNV